MCCKMATGCPISLTERRKFLQKADVILTIGVSSFTSLFFYSFDSAPLVAPQTQIIQLGEDLPGLGKNARGSLYCSTAISSQVSAYL